MPSATSQPPVLDFVAEDGHYVRFAPCPQRIRAMFNGKTVADSLCAALMRETGRMPVYYFPAADLRMGLTERSPHRTHCPYRGEASYWTLRLGGRQAENALWSYDEPPAALAGIKGWLGLQWDKFDHWFEEDEEVFGHARDPYHRVDVRPSSRIVRVRFAGQTIAETRRAMFLFETGLPTRYYIPPLDLRMEHLSPSPRTSICPYKGQASYWSLEINGQSVRDAAWAYLDPLPDCPRIKGYLCFYPEKVEVEVEGESRGAEQLMH